MKNEKILILDFGGQYNQLIARRVRERNVYCEVHPHTMSINKIKEFNPKGIIFTGGPNSVYLDNSPLCDNEIFDLGYPILGICYGCQLIAHMLGGNVATAPVSEYGKTDVEVDNSSKLFKNVDSIQSSVYYYVENKMLYAGPVWDFDLSAGVVATDSYQLYDKTELWAKFYDSFYKLLFQNDTFVQYNSKNEHDVKKLL